VGWVSAVSPVAEAVPERGTKQALWNAFCFAHGIAATGVPLFATDPNGVVEVFTHGRDGRPMLRRSAAMEELLAGTAERVLAAPHGEAEGVLYLMHRLDAAGHVVPLYVGKAGRYGRGGGVSVNLASIRTNTGKFSRWGYGYAYHMGDLSAAALFGHLPGKVTPKYRRWARSLFVEAPAEAPRLVTPVRFWCTAWGPNSRNIWPEFGACSLSFAEYLLIGVASLLFPADLLNDEGVNRAAAVTDTGAEAVTLSLQTSALLCRK
jgi:hypothetical protein